jgi:pyrroline-5-carboxylate reductase
MKKTTSIAFIGGGNMSRSLLGGLIADGCDPSSLWAADPDQAKLDVLRDQLGINVTVDSNEAVSKVETVVLAVKPQALRDVAAALASAIRARKPLVISIAAGVLEPDLRSWLGGSVALVRCMPNTPSLVGCGATALYANALVSEQQCQTAESILRAVGLTVWVDEETKLDAVTALSGSGPAYFFLVMEAMEKAGVSMGLELDSARLLTLQTAFGAAKMALEGSESPAELRARVTSPGGTTERAVGVLQAGELEALFAKALQTACGRSQELGKQLGGHS